MCRGHALLPCNNGLLIACPSVDRVSGPYQRTCVRRAFARSPDGGLAWNLSWHMHMRCLDDGMEGLKHKRECGHRVELDLQTLVCTRGRDFPIARIAERDHLPELIGRFERH